MDNRMSVDRHRSPAGLLVVSLALFLLLYLPSSSVADTIRWIRRRQILADKKRWMQTEANFPADNKLVLPPSSVSNVEGLGLLDDVENGIGQERRAQVAIVDVQTFRVKLAIVLQYVDETTADLLSEGVSSDPIVHRLCSAVNLQSGGSQARKSAAEDGLLVFTRSDYIFPQTGCRILDTNKVYYPGVEYIGLEILVTQEVSISKQQLPSDSSTTPTAENGRVSYDRVYRHVSRGFSGGTGGRAKFKQLLAAEDGATGEVIPEFQELQDVVLIKRLGDPVPRPTTTPTQSPISTATTAQPSKQPSTKAPINTKAPAIIATTTGSPSASPISAEPAKESAPNFILKTNPPTSVRPLAPGKGDIYGSAPSSPSNASPNRSESSSDDIMPIAAIAAAAGALAGIFVVGLISLYRYRKELQEYRKKDREELPVATALPAEEVRTRTRGWGSVPSHLPRPQPGPSGNAPPKLLGARRPPPIPAIVNDADGRSLAESTLGERTAGRKPWGPPGQPPPPVQFLKTAWVAGEGRKVTAAASSGVSFAVSHISSLDSGTIGGGGGGQTVGGFSLEAAIRDDDSDEDEREENSRSIAIQAGNASVGSDDGIASDDNESSSSEPPGKAAASSREDKDMTQPTSEASETAPISTPTESLNGTASLFEASTLNASIDNSNVTPDVDDQNDGVQHPDPPPDLTPRASGAGGEKMWRSPAHERQQYVGEGDKDDIGYVLPPALTPDKKKHITADESADENGRSWSSAFAAGTAAVLSASFSGAQNALPPPLQGGTPRPGSPDTFPDPGPLADPPISDETSRINVQGVCRILDKSWAALEVGQSSNRTDSSTVQSNIVTPDKNGEPNSPSSSQLLSNPRCPPSTPASEAIKEQETSTAGSGSSTSDNTSNHWLLDVVAGALGQRGKIADLESLSGRSNPSTTSIHSAPVRPSSFKKKSLRSSARSVGSKSRSSSHSNQSQGTAESKSIESDLKRLETQLKMLDEREKGELPTTTLSVTSGIGSMGSSSPTSPRSKYSTSSHGTRSRLDVRAPPGRLGVILANQTGGKGTVISALRTSSALAGKILPGDILVAIDGQDVSKMQVTEVTSIMSNKAQLEKVLTVVTPLRQRS